MESEDASGQTNGSFERSSRCYRGTGFDNSARQPDDRMGQSNSHRIDVRCQLSTVAKHSDGSEVDRVVKGPGLLVSKSRSCRSCVGRHDKVFRCRGSPERRRKEAKRGERKWTRRSNAMKDSSRRARRSRRWKGTWKRWLGKNGFVV